MWADGKLIVDLSETSINGQSFRYGEQVYRLHLGTETQEPDPVIEMHEGAGKAPAYRGLVYMTFDELPLRDFGNRIPNITAEIVASGDTKRVMEEQGLDVKIVSVKDHPQAWLAVETDRVDAYATDDVLLYGLISKSKTPDQFQVTGRFLSYDPYGIMVPRDDSAYR